MKKLYSLLGAMLVGASLFAQTNYTCTFSANVPMDSVQVKNTVSGEAKMLYYPDNVITLQKVGKTAVATVGNSTFLQQTANNIVAVNVETISLLNLTLYSANGTVVARYANNVNAGQYSFQVGASAGVYVLVASANGQTASLKISLQENAQAGIFEVATAESVAFLKSADDVITFNEGEEFEFTGYYKKQTDVKTSAIIESEE
ncbi:MAG: T9SS type A sorting domain-containing protein, partial [Bacteroidales bacterium]|nr:T9SS type A sorting domain-containing protein [Bacteroidales bacterium]